MPKKSEKHDLLFEIGTEELPPLELNRARQGLADNLSRGLTEARLAFDGLTSYASPRRLAVIVEHLSAQQKDADEVRLGPAAKAPAANGKPEPAALGFARSLNISAKELVILDTPKGKRFSHRLITPGKATVTILADIISKALLQLPIARPMRWGEQNVPFIRPVHWLVLLYHNKPVPCQLFGVTSSNKTYGHRFLAPRAITIHQPRDYVEKLRNSGRVLVDVMQRQERIRTAICEQARALGGTPRLPEKLLNEINGLVEWPIALHGAIPERFLSLPREILIAVLQDQQRFIPLCDAEDRLLPHFIAIANIEAEKPEVICRGYERVILPRLADAEFFWDSDRKHMLAEAQKHLANVVFQQDLGTLHDKQQRLDRLMRQLAPMVALDTTLAVRAAALAKCDLLSKTVGEFPSLQGVIGALHATADGEAPEVCDAIRDQYRPHDAEDQIPATALGCLLAFADRLDTLAGFFLLGKQPRHDKDPYALKRSALAALRITIEGTIHPNIRKALATALQGFPQTPPDNLVDALVGFMLERLRSYCLERGIRVDVFAAVHASTPADMPYDFYQRCVALNQFCKHPSARTLGLLNKRTANILRPLAASVASLPKIDPSLLKQKEEQHLYETLITLRNSSKPLIQKGYYDDVLIMLAGIKSEIEGFFDVVMVMSDNAAERNNRLRLLLEVRVLFLQVADLSLLSYED